MVRLQNMTNASMRGLSAIEVEDSRRKNGANVFTGQKRKSLVQKYAESFGDPIIKILMVALAINIFFAIQSGNYFETVGIAVAVFLSTFVSTLSEYGSETAFLRLKEEADRLVCRVRRAGGLCEISVSDVVVGDLVLLSAGERIPADGVLISGELRVDESALNGESRETKKSFLDGAELFRGTVVCDGEGILLVQKVGDDTLYGRLAGELQTEAIDSPMKVRLAVLARQISKLGYTAAFMIAFADLFHGIVMENHYIKEEILADLCNLPMMAEHLIHALLLAISVIVVAVQYQ